MESSWGKMIGLRLTNSCTGFTLRVPSLLTMADGSKIDIEEKSVEYTKRKPNKLEDEKGNFSMIQYLDIIPQYSVVTQGQTFRLDFAFLLYEDVKHKTRLVKKIGVECDGYDYHSDKVQFRRDRDRIRGLIADSWTIIPFSGSTIYNFNRHPEIFLKEVAKIFSQLGFSHKQ